MIELLKYARKRKERMRQYCGTHLRHLFYSTCHIEIAILNKMKELQGEKK